MSVHGVAMDLFQARSGFGTCMIATLKTIAMISTSTQQCLQQRSVPLIIATRSVYLPTLCLTITYPLLQITKHLARVEGEQVFTGLLTVTNEKGEIRTCNLVATKAQSQSEPALMSMDKSLRLYGQSHPLVFFTDNMADKSFLERCFPSLRNNVVPIEKYGNLEEFKLPPPPVVEILPKDTPLSIDDAMRSILEDVPLNNGFLVVGFDAEWNIELSPRGNVVQRGKTAIIQIAYQNRVYILQVCFLFYFYYKLLLFDSRSATCLQRKSFHIN